MIARVGIIAIQQECNTRLDAPTTLEHFRNDTLLTGEQIRPAFEQGHHEIAGFFHGLQQNKLVAVPLLAALATPAGIIEDDAANHLLTLMRQQLESAGQLQGLLVAPHGAAVSHSHQDFDGHWLDQLRHMVGPNIPIVATVDPHANVSPAMVRACNAIIAYRTNPHLDQHRTGVTGADLLARTLRGEVQPTMAHCAPPVTISIDRQQTDAHPCTILYHLADRILDEPDVLSNSVILGFPYADVPDMGSSFIVVADNNAATAQQHARDLAQVLIDHRHEFRCQLPDVDQAIDLLKQSNERTCLLDVGDNVGGGSPGDGTVLLHALASAGISSVFVCIADPQAAQAARNAGPGVTLQLPIGGRTDTRHGQPFNRSVTVKSLHDQPFHEHRPRHGGRQRYEIGPSAVVVTPEGITLLLTSRRVPPFSLEMIRSCDLEPASFRVLVAKGVNAPIAAYAEVCDRFIRVNTPGVTCADPTKLTWQHRRRPLYPFEALDSPTAAAHFQCTLGAPPPRL